MEVIEGESASASIRFRADLKTNEALSVRVEVPPIIGSILGVKQFSYDEFEAEFNLLKSAPSGIHTGNIRVQLCRDRPQDCTQPYLSSPWVLPYKIIIHSIGPKLTTLRRLEGATSGWTQAYANSSVSSSIQTSEVLDPSKFAIRWHIRQTNPKPIDPDFVADGGIVSLQKGEINSSGRTLEIVSEASGSPLWQRAITSYSKGTIQAQGKIFLLEQLNNSTSRLHAFDPLTGASIFAKEYPIDSNQQLITDGNSIYTQTPVLRWDAATGNLVWRETPIPDSYAGYRPIRVDGQVYSYGPDGLRQYHITNGNAKIVVSADKRLEHQAAGDGKNNLFLISSAGGSVSTRRFSTSDSSIVWRKDYTGIIANAYSFDLPAVDTSALYVPVVAYPSDTGPSIVAYSIADGSILWTISPQGLREKTRMVAAGNLLFVSSFSPYATKTYAINKLTGAVVWSLPVAGSLALSENGTLYIVSAAARNEGGSVTAVNLR